MESASNLEMGQFGGCLNTMSCWLFQVKWDCSQTKAILEDKGVMVCLIVQRTIHHLATNKEYVETERQPTGFNSGTNL